MNGSDDRWLQMSGATRGWMRDSHLPERVLPTRPAIRQSAYPGYLRNWADCCNKENPVATDDGTGQHRSERSGGDRLLESRPFAVDAEKSRGRTSLFDTAFREYIRTWAFKLPPLGISSAYREFKQARISPGSGTASFIDGCPRHRASTAYQHEPQKDNCRDDSAFTGSPQYHSRCNCGLPMRWNDAGLLVPVNIWAVAIASMP